MSLRRNRVPLRRDRGRHRARHRASRRMFSTMRHAFAKDPIPQKSDVLHYVRLDTWDPLQAVSRRRPSRPPHADHLPRHGRDHEVATSRCGRAGCSRPTSTCSRTRRSAARSKDARRGCASPTSSPCSTCRSSTARAGTEAPTQGPEPVVVLGEETNDQLFGGQDSVGKTRAHRGPRVPGGGRARHLAARGEVLRHHPERRAAARSSLHAVQLPAPDEDPHRGQQRRLEEPAGARASRACSSPRLLDPDVGGAARRGRACRRYKDFLDAYVDWSRRRPGRFPRPLNNRVTPLMALAEGAEGRARRGHRDDGRVAALPGRVRAEPDGPAARQVPGPRARDRRAARAGRARAATSSSSTSWSASWWACIGRRASASLLSLGGLAVLNNWVKTLAQRGDLFQLRRADGRLSPSACRCSPASWPASIPAWRVCRIPPAIHLKLQ